MASVLIVGATRGLGAALVTKYAARPSTHVFGTSRGSDTPKAADNVTYFSDIDVATESAGSKLAEAINKAGERLDVTIISAGYFGKESFDEPNWDAEVKMYTTSSIGPVFLVHHLSKAGLFKKGSKVILVSSESGSITLRHEKEGGGNYGHHASKTALNMVGKLLSLDLKDKGVAVGIVHPGFMVSDTPEPGWHFRTQEERPPSYMLYLYILARADFDPIQRTEMTRSVGFDKFWDDGGGQSVSS